MRLGIAILRAVVGGFFVGHGLQKLKGLEATAGGFESMGLKPGKVHATAAAVAETGGGALLAAGLATPVAAAALTGTMTVAIDTVHAAKGPWNTEGGYEYNAVLMAAVFAITAEGPGALSFDRRDWARAGRSRNSRRAWAARRRCCAGRTRRESPSRSPRRPSRLARPPA
jgi:putative oxidoreductase